MIKKPFLVFIAIVGALILGMILFIQSAQFARVFKTVIARYLPAELGIKGDFSEFAIKLFPPGISIKHPKISVGPHNVAGLPPGSEVAAEQIDLTFLPFQMFSGNIRVHEVAIQNGDIRLILDPTALGKKSARKSFRPEFNWDELFQVHAEAVAIKNSRIHVEMEHEFTLDLEAKSLRLGQWSGRGGLGYELWLDLAGMHGTFPESWHYFRSLDRLNASVRVNALGMEIEALNLGNPGLGLNASGSVKGNVLSPKTLQMELNTQGNVDLKQWLDFAPFGVEGLCDFSAKVKGNLLANESLRAEGKLSAREVRFKSWHADRVELEGGWSAGQGGELALTRAVISAKEQARGPGGFRPGDGGKVEIGAVKVPLSLREPVTVPIKLERAHIHWLGAPVLKEVYPLDLRITGPVQATYLPPHGKTPWQVQTKLGLTVEGFQLDNQKFKLNKPLKRILKIDKFTLNGPASLDPSGIHVDGIDLGLRNLTRVKAQGKIDFKTGYDLFGEGSVDLAEFGQLAETDIRGKGTLKVHVHGPTKRVLIDFDPDIRDASYLHLALGAIQGRITWDDDPDRLIFENVQAQKGHTHYVGNGTVDVGKIEKIDLGFDVPQGDISDFIQIFDFLTKDLWWFPHTLTGGVSGSIKVSGGIDLNQLQVVGQMRGADWELMGERFKKVDLAGGYDRGKYFVSDLRATKRYGRLSARISYDLDQVFDWQLHTQEMTVNDLDLFAKLDVPIRGKLLVDSLGHGKVADLQSSTQLSLSELAVRGVAIPPSQLTVKMNEGMARLSSSIMGGQGILDATYGFKPGTPSAIHGELRHLDFTPGILLLNSKLIQDHDLVGVLSGGINLNFKSGQIERASGSADLNEYRLAKHGADFQLVQPVSFRISDGSFDLKSLSIRGRQGEATLALRGQKSGLEGAITGDIDASLAEFVTPVISQAMGTADLDFTIGGTIKDPTLFGQATLGGLTVKVPSVDAPFENVTGAFQLKQNAVSIQNIQADLGGGRITSNGSVLLFAHGVSPYPTVSIKAQLSGTKLEVYPFDFVKVNGWVAVHGDDLPYMVDGSINVDSALSRTSMFSQKKSEGFKATQYLPPARKRGEGDYPVFKLNIDAVADRGILIKNNLFDAEVKGHVTLVNTLDAPRVLGTAEVIQGKLTFKDRQFQVQSASANFDNPSEINPSFNLNANTDANGVKIQLYASGRFSDPKIELTSNPVMSEPEIISLLTLGLNPNDARRLNPTDKSLIEQGEGMSLLLNSMDFNRDVQNKTGLQVQIDESVNSQIGTSAFRPQSNADTTSAPRIVIKRKIGKDMEVSYGSTVGVGTNSQKEVNAEYHVTPGFSVIGVWDDNAPTDTTMGTTVNKDIQSYGVDFKVQKRFK